MRDGVEGWAAEKGTVEKKAAGGVGEETNADEKIESLGRMAAAMMLSSAVIVPLSAIQYQCCKRLVVGFWEALI